MQRIQRFSLFFYIAVFFFFLGREVCQHTKRHLWPLKYLKRTKKLLHFFDAVSLPVGDDRQLATQKYLNFHSNAEMVETNDSLVTISKTLVECFLQRMGSIMSLCKLFCF
jgi:hypothetical protein